jgi:hypothetical protein
VEVTLEGDQMVVVGRIPEPQLGSAASAQEKDGAAAGRISRFREETRGHRIAIAREAEARFEKFVTWGAACGGVTERFTPGGSGRGEGKARSVMIGWRHRRRGAWRRGLFGYAPWMHAPAWRGRGGRVQGEGPATGSDRPDQQIF